MGQNHFGESYALMLTPRMSLKLGCLHSILLEHSKRETLYSLYQSYFRKQNCKNDKNGFIYSSGSHLDVFVSSPFECADILWLHFKWRIEFVLLFSANKIVHFKTEEAPFEANVPHWCAFASGGWVGMWGGLQHEYEIKPENLVQSQTLCLIFNARTCKMYLNQSQSGTWSLVFSVQMFLIL